MKKEEVYTALRARLKLLADAVEDTEVAIERDDPMTVKMAIRDMGFHVFEMHQHLLRLPEHSVDLTK